MHPGTFIENPYASPAYVQSRADSDASLRAPTKLYRGMGLAGIAYHLAAYTTLLIVEFSEGRPELFPVLGLFMLFAVVVTFFMLMIATGNRLETDFDRSCRRARWIAILAAAIWLPILTVPGIIAVRRLERCRKTRATLAENH